VEFSYYRQAQRKNKNAQSVAVISPQ